MGLGLDERARVGDEVEDALVERSCGNRLGEEFGDAGIARAHHAVLFGVSGQHDDGYVGIGVGLRLAVHQFQAVEDWRYPVGDDDVRTVLREGLEARGAILGLVHFTRAEPVQ